MTVDGKPIHRAAQNVYYLFYKPRGVLTTLRDPAGRPDLRPFLERIPARVYPVGRLDRSSEGLLLLTNDGALAYRLMHPRYHVGKTYRVTVTGRPKEEVLRAMAAGLHLPDLVTQPVSITVLAEEEDRTRLRITVYEGQYRLIRRMFGAFGHDVLRLCRIAIGPLRDPRLRPGAVRPLTASEVRDLWAAVGGNHES